MHKMQFIDIQLLKYIFMMIMPLKSDFKLIEFFWGQILISELKENLFFDDEGGWSMTISALFSSQVLMFTRH